jgi:hypothetical protein
MKRSALYLEHRYKGRFLKAHRFESGRGPIYLGSARENDLHLLGHEVAGIHAVIENHSGDWKVSDLGSITGTHIANEKGDGHIVEHRIDGDTEVRIGTHELKLCVREPRDILFNEKGGKPGSHQQIIVKFNGKVIDTHVLPKDHSFSGIIAGEKVTLPPIKGGEPVHKEIGRVSILQLVIDQPEVIAEEPMNFKIKLTTEYRIQLLRWQCCYFC